METNEVEQGGSVEKLGPWWTVGENGLERKFVAKDFCAALEWFAEVGKVAEGMGHHPDLHLTEYRAVRVCVKTHSLGQITDKDFELAKKIDTVPVSYSPKWARENPSLIPKLG